MKTILFDLDGTITQPASGIINSFIHALQSLGQPAPAKETLHWVIGPALRESFGKFLQTSSDIEAALAHYRKFYRAQGIFDAHLFDGIPETLATLQAGGYQLFVCTAKPQPFALRVLEYFKVDHFFQAVYGPDFDGRMDNKAHLLNHIIEENTLSPRHCCLIGDRLYDATAALQNNVTPIGALWGFGSEQELRDAGVNHFCKAPADIPGMVKTLSR